MFPLERRQAVDKKSKNNTGVNPAGGQQTAKTGFNRKIQDAQKDYVVFMKSNGSGASAARQDFSKNATQASWAPNSEIKHIALNQNASVTSPQPFDLKKMHSPGTGIHNIAKLEKMSLKASTIYLVPSATYGTDVHKGAELARDVYGTAALEVVDNARLTLAKSIQKSASCNLDVYDKLLKETGGEHMLLKYGIKGQISGQKDVANLQRGINMILQQKYGVTIKGTGKVGWWNVSRFLRKNSGTLSMEIQNLIKTAYRDAMNIQVLTGNGRVGRLRALNRMGMRRLGRYIRQSEAGYGAYLTYNILMRGRSLLRGALFTVRAAGRAGYKALVMTAKGAAWCAGKVAKHVPKSVKNNKYIRKAANAKNRAARLGMNAHRKGQRAIDRFRKFRRDPFGIKARITGAGRRAANAALNRLNKTALRKPIKIGGKFLKGAGRVIRIPNIISSALGKVIAAIASIVSAVLSFLLVGVIIIVIILLLVGFIINFFTSVLAAFDFTAHEEEIVNAALVQIEESYEAQIDNINAMRGNYRNLTITYKDVRDDDAYEEHEVSIAETTNSAELLSMATVYFDFDLEEAGKNKVVDYVKKLFNGSHQTSVAEKTYNFTDENGDSYTVTDADVTLTTYYFNALFDCELTDNYGTLRGSTTAMQIWNYFRSAGFSEEATAGIMANLNAESGLNPAAIQSNGAGPAAGIAQWENYNKKTQRWKSLYDFCTARGKPWTDLQCQLDFIINELPGVFSNFTGIVGHYSNGQAWGWPEKMTLDEFKKITDVKKATEIFERVFERGSVTRMQRRYEYAETFYNTYKGMEAPSEEAQAVIDRAYEQMGKPYVKGAVGPDSFDCSGLVGYALTGKYVRIGTTHTYMTWPRVSNPQPGDICTSEKHCGIYIGNNQMIHAPHTGDVVKIGTVKSDMIFVRYPG